MKLFILKKLNNQLKRDRQAYREGMNNCTQVTYANNLPEISSEFIEPYAQRFLMMQLESVALGLITPAEAKEYMKGAEYFITTFSAIHGKMATSNEYDKFMSLSDHDLKTIADKVFH